MCVWAFSTGSCLQSSHLFESGLCVIANASCPALFIFIHMPWVAFLSVFSCAFLDCPPWGMDTYTRCISYPALFTFIHMSCCCFVIQRFLRLHLGALPWFEKVSTTSVWVSNGNEVVACIVNLTTWVTSLLTQVTPSATHQHVCSIFFHCEYNSGANRTI